MKCFPKLLMAIVFVSLCPGISTGQVPEPAPTVVGAGGGTSVSGTTFLFDTVGQPVIGVMTESGDVHKSGFWYLTDQLSIGPLVAVLIESFHAHAAEKGVVLNWHVASAAGLRGFAIYRSSGSEDEYVRLNEDALLPATETSFTDSNVRPSQTYWYRLGAIDTDGEFLASPQRVVTPHRDVELSQNYPNPFNPQTRIDFYLPVDGRVSLTVFDVKGKRVTTLVDEHRRFGHASETWDGTDQNGERVSSGVYFYRLTFGSQAITKKLVVLK